MKLETGNLKLEGIGPSHSELVLMAEKWLKRFGCNVVFRELSTATVEIPDAIGWKGGASILIECKASRSDFLSDRKKSFREFPAAGMGQYRLYMCPVGVINPDDLQDGWGLLWVRGKITERVVAPPGNCFWADCPVKSFDEFNWRAERTMLLSALRRLQIRGHFNEIYEPMPARPVIPDENLSLEVKL